MYIRNFLELADFGVEAVQFLLSPGSGAWSLAGFQVIVSWDLDSENPIIYVYPCEIEVEGAQSCYEFAHFDITNLRNWLQGQGTHLEHCSYDQQGDVFHMTFLDRHCQITVEVHTTPEPPECEGDDEPPEAGVYIGGGLDWGMTIEEGAEFMQKKWQTELEGDDAPPPSLRLRYPYSNGNDHENN